MWLTKLQKMQNVPDAKQHQLLYVFFKDADERPFCYKDTGDQIIMLSSIKPNTQCQEVHFEAGKTLMFECLASINKRRFKDKVIRPQDFTAEHIKEWFKRKFDGCAYIDYVAFKKFAPHKIPKDDGRMVFLNQTLFFGTLTIMNPKKFEELLVSGVGIGGVYGFGLVYLPQVMQ